MDPLVSYPKIIQCLYIENVNLLLLLADDAKTVMLWLHHYPHQVGLYMEMIASLYQMPLGEKVSSFRRLQDYSKARATKF